jgi:hypothetical protein
LTRTRVRTDEEPEPDDADPDDADPDDPDPDPDDMVPSINTSRPPLTPEPRTTADEAPERISASVGAPRNDERDANHPTASSSEDLPSPLPPSITVSPSGANETEADA